MTLATARRSLVMVARIPSAIVPTVVFPVFFVVAFGGAFSALVRVPNFPADHILDWYGPWAMIQGSAFAGVGTSFGVARDLEDGFYDRFLVSPMSRIALVTGPMLAASIRALLPFFTVLPIALAAGASLKDPVLGFMTLFVAAQGVAVCAGLWGLGVAFRLKTQRSGALIQVGIFVTMFLSIGQVPLSVMTGWLHGVARINPATNVLRLARQGFLGDVTWAQTWPGLLAIAGGIVLLGAFAVRGQRTLVP